MPYKTDLELFGPVERAYLMDGPKPQTALKDGPGPGPRPRATASRRHDQVQDGKARQLSHGLVVHG